MSEKLLVINGMRFDYKGIFEFDELLKVAHKAVTERGYVKHEKKFDEKVMPEGKEIYIELRPRKSKTAYYQLMIKIKITMKKLTEVKVTMNGLPRSMYQGEVTIVFDAWTTTDYEDRWGNKPVLYFLKTFINKYIYKFPLESGFPGEVADDTRYVYNQIRSALGLYKFKTSASKIEKVI